MSFDPHGAPAEQLRMIEWLKAELVASCAAVYRAMVGGANDAVADALASVVLSAYVLGRRLGVTFGDMDQRVTHRANQLALDHEVERSYGDLSALVKHLHERTGDGHTRRRF